MTSEKFIVKIDAGVSSGKNTLADNLVQSTIFNPYNVKILNSGDFLRAAAFEALRNGIDPSSRNFRTFILSIIDKIDMFKLNGLDLSASEINKTVPYVTAITEARKKLLQIIPETVQKSSEEIILLLGRPVGNICSEAQIKIYLETSDEVAIRRSEAKQENFESGQDLIKRNTMDQKSWGSTFVPSADNVVINTDHFCPDLVCRKATENILPIYSLWAAQHPKVK